MIQPPPEASVKFGAGWREFCKMHASREGDKLIF